MHWVLAAAFFFAILTLWVPAEWPVAVFQVSVFALAGLLALRRRNSFPSFSYPLIPLSIAAAWGLFQWFSGQTVYLFDTATAIVHWTTFLAVFVAGWLLFRDVSVSRQFRSAMLWFAFLVSIWAVLQSFTSGGKVLWIFPSGYEGNIMGPILSRNHYAAFVEVVLPMALYEAFRRERDSLLYSGIAAALYSSVIASASRAGTLLATSEIVMVIALMWIRREATGRVLGFTALKIAALSVAFVAIVGWQAVWNRFWLPDPFVVRREFTLSTVHMIADRPWFGFGLGTWPTAYPQYALIDVGLFANRAHDDWLEWTAEGGLPFGIMMATLFLWCLRPAFRSIWGLGVVAVFSHAAVDYPFSRPALGAWPILVIAMLAAHGGDQD